VCDPPEEMHLRGMKRKRGRQPIFYGIILQELQNIDICCIHKNTVSNNILSTKKH
jgi:hypothetical protein